MKKKLNIIFLIWLIQRFDVIIDVYNVWMRIQGDLIGFWMYSMLSICRIPIGSRWIMLSNIQEDPMRSKLEILRPEMGVDMNENIRIPTITLSSSFYLKSNVKMNVWTNYKLTSTIWMLCWHLIKKRIYKIDRSI